MMKKQMQYLIMIIGGLLLLAAGLLILKTQVSEGIIRLCRMYLSVLAAVSLDMAWGFGYKLKHWLNHRMLTAR